MRKPVTQPQEEKKPGGFPARVCLTPDPEVEPDHKAFQAGQPQPDDKKSGDES